MAHGREGSGWSELARWWRDELTGDPGYEEDVTPLVLDLLAPEEGGRYLDAGCGEGRLMAELSRRGVQVLGLDESKDLLASARRHGPVVRHRLPNLACLADACLDGCLVSLVLEHVADHITFFAELARVTRPGGVLALVVNHPTYTAPDSAPIQEEDGEITWRPGRYLSRGHTDEPAGETTVRFHHRPMGDLLTVASMMGWDLQRLVEEGPSQGQIIRHPPLALQRHIPRLLGARWARRAS